MPMRSIGIKWLKVDPEQRALQVTLDTPEKMLPRGPLNIGLQVAGAGANEDAYVTVAAVDVGILNLTRYEPPNPEDWYFGQRQLGLRNPRPLWPPDRRLAGCDRQAQDRR